MCLKPVVMFNITATVVPSLLEQKEHVLGRGTVTESEGVKSPSQVSFR